jgi:hypothetical protein
MNIIGNFIYIFGGFYHGKFLNTMYIIDLEESEVINIIYIKFKVYLSLTSKNLPEARAYH